LIKKAGRRRAFHKSPPAGIVGKRKNNYWLAYRTQREKQRLRPKEKRRKESSYLLERCQIRKNKNRKRKEASKKSKVEASSPKNTVACHNVQKKKRGNVRESWCPRTPHGPKERKQMGAKGYRQTKNGRVRLKP